MTGRSGSTSMKVTRARFDPLNNTLYECWIQTQDRSWGNCAPNSKTCGIANALQYSVGENGQTWFTEWSENKIGRILAPITNKNNNQQLPFSVSASSQELTLRRGQSIEVKLNISTTRALLSCAPSNANIDMVTSGTFTPTGELSNITGSLSEQSFSLEPTDTKQVSFIFTAALDVGLGVHKMMQ